jgi:TrpR-related protein YerC/YecD
MSTKKLPEIQQKETFKAHTLEEKQLVQSFLQLKNEEEMGNFLRDLMTTAEIEEFSNRIEIARLLLTEDLSYMEISKKVGTSTTTVTRVAQWLFKGCGGYFTALQRMLKLKK